jgi:hypothetical protein
MVYKGGSCILWSIREGVLSYALLGREYYPLVYKGGSIILWSNKEGVLSFGIQGGSIILYPRFLKSHANIVESAEIPLHGLVKTDKNSPSSTQTRN